MNAQLFEEGAEVVHILRQRNLGLLVMIFFCQEFLVIPLLKEKIFISFLEYLMLFGKIGFGGLDVALLVLLQASIFLAFT